MLMATLMVSPCIVFKVLGRVSHSIMRPSEKAGPVLICMTVNTFDLGNKIALM